MGKKILLILVVILVAAGVIWIVFPSKADHAERIFTSEEISDLKEISIKGSFNANVTVSDSKDIKCSFSKIRKGIVIGSYDFKGSIENNVLYITTSSSKNAIFTVGFQSITLNIEIPKTYKNKLSIKSELGNVNISHSNSKDIECDTDDGNIKISLDNIPENINVNTGIGNVDLRLPKNEKFNLSAESELGKVTNNLKSNVDNYLKEKFIKLSSSDGNITISAS